MRLLLCHDCKTVDELPDFSGKPEDDVFLQYVIDRQHPPVGGEVDHKGTLFYIEDQAWKANKDEIVKEMWKKTTGFEPEFYATRATFQEDAAKCWTKEHNRPTFCADFRTEKKRIQNPTKELARSQNPKIKVYLCDFCVVRTNVISHEREKNPNFDPEVL